MSTRHALSIFLRILVLLSFISAPMLDHAHAINMLRANQNNALAQTLAQTDAQTTNTQMPCHSSKARSDEQIVDKNAQSSSFDAEKSEQSNKTKPCCPEKTCTGNNCLVNTALATLNDFEFFPFLLNDHRNYLDADSHFVSLPVAQMLRPPIHSHFNI